jgi:flavin-binding protein dodecin
VPPFARRGAGGKIDMAKKSQSRSSSESGTKIYKMTELVGTSRESFAAATDAAVKRACQTLRNVDWFEVSELRGAVKDGKISQYQVKVKIGFRLD